LIRGINKALIERALGADLSRHLGYASGGIEPVHATNQRNGTSGTTVLRELPDSDQGI
jgi:transposase-like protein